MPDVFEAEQRLLKLVRDLSHQELVALREGNASYRSIDGRIFSVAERVCTAIEDLLEADVAKREVGE